MLRYKRQIQMALIPPILYISYKINNKIKTQSKLNQEQSSLLQKYKFLKAQIPFDSKSLNTKDNFIPQSLLNTIYSKYRIKSEMKQNLQQRKYDLLILGSSPLAALTLLQASNRGLDAALISQSEFGSFDQQSKQQQLGQNIEILDSGRQIFFKALSFKYGALSFSMMRHAFHLNKSQYELKDLAPRSLKEIKYNHYYSADLGVFAKIRQNAKDILWNFLNMIYSVSWTTDAGISYAQKCDRNKNFEKQNNNKEPKNTIFNSIDSIYGLKRAIFKSKNMEVNWNRVVRDALLTASIKGFYFLNKKDADFMSNVSFKDIMIDDRSGNIQSVTVVDNLKNQNFKIKTRAVIDFREGTIRNDKLHHQQDSLKSIGIYRSQENKFQTNFNPTHYHFCVQSPYSTSFFKNPLFLQGYSFSKYEKNSTMSLQNQISPSLKLNNVRIKDRKLKRVVSNQDLALDKILNTDYKPSSSLAQYQLDQSQGQINQALLKFRKIKKLFTYKTAELLNKTFKFLGKKIFNTSSYNSLQKPYKFKYEYQSDSKGNWITISGGNPSFVIENSKQIIERLLKEQNFRGTAYEISSGQFSVGEYVLNGSYSAPSVAAFDTSPGTSMLSIQKFKQQVQSKYLINDWVFYHLFYNYGYIGTLKIIDIGMQNQLIQTNQLQSSQNSQKLQQSHKQQQQQQQKKQQIILAQGKQQLGNEKSSTTSLQHLYPFSLAQVLYLIKYQQLNCLNDLFFNRWGLQFEPANQINQLIMNLKDAKRACKDLKKLVKRNSIQGVVVYLEKREQKYGF